VPPRPTDSHHDYADYHCIACENCRRLIPLLEVDAQKQRRNPPKFQKTCPFCGHSGLYTDAEVQVAKVRRVRGFVPADGFKNVSR